MIIFISPAKGFEKVDKQKLPVHDNFSQPEFIDKSREIIDELKKLSIDEIKKLMKVKDEIATLNYERFRNFHMTNDSYAALFSYSGIQYKSIDPYSFDVEAIKYISSNLRILSGLYGVLKPFDSISPYRLEMLTSLSIKGSRNLYRFWDRSIYESLKRDSEGVILNLASEEYSKTVKKYIEPDIIYVSCQFKVRKDDKLKVMSTASKKARGKMIRFIAENKISNFNDLKNFNDDGFIFDEKLSSSDGNTIEFVFVAEK